ncbi:nodulation protein NodH [Rhodophyticola sp. CCM32]|uniref:nodulation protein NodH n=1 Tax=Rhodophyticola sp. CCM32 TaxID=2916397 RepID=UPI00107FB5F7|nr:nodulation protein NodH [Rhodophyticola sp. CCM32]QBY02036.1 nodulation protein NodH [Rhodophyticola sp. CCM32]
MPRRFDAFVIFAEMRTGSNYLEATVNEFTDLDCLGEVFNPTFMGHQKTFEMYGIDMAAREKNPLRLYDALLQNTDGLPGFRFFHDHDARVLDRVLPDPRVAKIILTRNPLESYVSRKIAAATGQWRLTDMKHQRKAGKIRFVPAEFEEMLDQLQQFQLRLQNGLQRSGQTAFYIAYDDINDLDVINGMARFLGAKEDIAAANSKLKRQNPSDLRQKVENYDEMAATVSALDRFDLTRTPNFEPRRHPGVPGFYALPETGLLFMPVKGSVVEPVIRWMAGLEGIAPDDLKTRMNQKELRQWLRKHVGHRSFTILRHPVVRAYDVFNRHILPSDPPGYTDARRVLRKMYGLPIPAKGLVDGYGVEDHKAAFLAFLAFLKGNLQGQTSLKVDPAWATQTAILQGMAGVTLPDQLIREEDMADALPVLAAGLGHEGAGFDAVDAEAPFPLTAIHDDAVEDAAMQVYRRDYLNFGYGRWAMP